MQPQVFTREQENILVGILLSDGFLETSSDTSNARLLIQFTVQTEALFKSCLDLYQDWITEKPKVVKKAVYDSKSFEQNSLRTCYHPVFTNIYHNFYVKIEGKKVRVTPSVSYLKDKLTWEGFAYLLMGDGSRKGIKNRGYEIHVQGQGFEGAVRLSIALYEIFKIKSWPAYDNYKNKNKSYWNIYISSESFDLWAPKVIDIFSHCEMYEAKMPQVDLRPYKAKNNLKFDKFYTMFKDNMEVRENTIYKVPQDILDKYRECQKERKTKN